MCQKKIMRKRSHESFHEEHPKKKLSRSEYVAPKKIPLGVVLTDLTGKQWRVGKVIGHGGFGDIYLASDNIHGPVKNDAPYVVKIESHSNGPLFVEINCMIRIAKNDMIKEWTGKEHTNFLGMPNYIASGSHIADNERLRFLILPRYDQDLEKILNNHYNKFNLKTVVNICTQILDTLEYIHSKGFVHCDIKASNILHKVAKPSVLEKNTINNILDTPKRQFYLRTGRKQLTYKRRTLRTTRMINYNENDRELEQYFLEELDNMNDIHYQQPIKTSQKEHEKGKVYLMDYGLAMKYRLSNGQHRQYCNDERKAHAGTLLFCSLDAHLGSQSRRSDLECLGYNMIYWLTSRLPWENVIDSPEAVEKEKKINFLDLDKFLKYCFCDEYPQFVYDYFNYIRKLSFEQKPDYKFCKNLLISALDEFGYKNDSNLDFDNLEGWGKKQKSKKKSEIVSHKNSPFIPRQPLLSNTPIKKPILRGKKTKKTKKLNWSKILSSDPEKLLKNTKVIKEEMRPRDRRITDPSESPLQNLDLPKLNPTYHMTEIYNRSRDRNGNYTHVPMKNGKGDSFICVKRDGFTPAMNIILTKIKQGKLAELQCQAIKRNRITKTNMKRTDVKKTQSAPCIAKDLKKHKAIKVVRRQGLRG